MQYKIPNEVMEQLPSSVLTKKQVKLWDTPALVAEVRCDDECGNGHNSFAITATSYEVSHDERVFETGGGCMHDEIAHTFPELAPFIKWHLTSSDGPMHYLANTIYQAGDRDHRGGRKGEPSAWGVRKLVSQEIWSLLMGREPDKKSKRADGRHYYTITGHRHLSSEEAALVASRLGGDAYVTYRYEGKKRELEHARSSAVWPEATDEQLCLPPDELAKLLIDRLPALMREFKEDVESLGFIY